MNACEFFLEQDDTVRSIVNDLFLKGVSDEQLRHQLREGLHSMARHTTEHLLGGVVCRRRVSALPLGL